MNLERINLAELLAPGYNPDLFKNFYETTTWPNYFIEMGIPCSNIHIFNVK